MKTISKYLAPLTLFEWGAIMLYFYLSGRIAAFLHPNFRPLILITGILLVLTATVLVIWGNEAPCAHEHDEHDHSHDHDHATCGHDHHDDEHAHGKLTFGGALAFLVLLLPVALAVKISPDSYGETLINNRGTIENVAALPGVAARMQKRATEAMRPDVPRSNDSLEPPLPMKDKPRFAGQSIAGQTEPPPQRNLDDDLPLPTKDGSPQLIDPVTPKEAGTLGSEYENPFLKPNQDGNIKVEVIDLMYASMDSPTRKDFDGKRVEMFGQFVAVPSQFNPPGTFKLTRLFMVCCAADVQPISVKIVSRENLGKYASMAWLKVVGRVSFPTVGDRPTPVVTAERITPVNAPEEKYLY